MDPTFEKQMCQNHERIISPHVISVSRLTLSTNSMTAHFINSMSKVDEVVSQEKLNKAPN